VKKIVVIVLLIQMLSLTCKDLLTYAYFYANQDYIANNFCVNRDVPEILCSGRCYLKKSIEANQKDHQDVPNPTTEKKTIPVFLSMENNALLSYAFGEGTDLKIDYLSDSYSFTYLNRIFHPPKNAGCS